MKIYDCFMFFDEEMLLDLRLNIMDKYVDKFVITEASYMHSGKPKKLLFDINKFSKFKDKIIYIIVNDPPPRLLEISDLDKSDVRDLKNTAELLADTRSGKTLLVLMEEEFYDYIENNKGIL